jgi:HTH-type transcriptional regulator, glycine betaine synthesis regulator
LGEPLSLETQETAPLSPLELEVIEFFLQLFKLLNLPKSVAEIYGLLFASGQPLPMDEIVSRLNLSKGGASQGLKLLRDHGAVRIGYHPGDRRDYYEIETGMKRLVENFIKSRMVPQLERIEGRLENIEQMLEKDPVGGGLETRVKNLRTWQSKVRKLLPQLKKLMED